MSLDGWKYLYCLSKYWLTLRSDLTPIEHLKFKDNAQRRLNNILRPINVDKLAESITYVLL